MPADWPPGELMQSVTYRESFAPAVMPPAPAAHLFRELSSAPQPLRTAAGAGWALVSLITAGAVAAVVLVLAVQVVRALT